jgi:DNA mismatch repair protein MutS2
VAEERAEAAARAAAEAETIREDLAHRQSELAADEARVRQDARTRIRRELRELERLVEKSRREVESARIEQARVDLARARAQVDALPSDEPRVFAPTVDPEAIEAGTRVWLRGMDSAGEALAEPDEDGELEVQLGSLRTRVRIEQVERIDAPQRVWVDRSRVALASVDDVGEEIDLRGRTIDEALPSVDGFLDHAARAGRPRVRIIHGKGTGTLRRAVRDFMDRHPLVKGYETAVAAEGGEGVTIALLEQV